MKAIAVLFTAVTLAAATGLAQARDVNPQEIIQLHQAGTLKPFEELNKAAQALHPDANITETDLEEHAGRYIYQVELRNAQGVEWDVELDAVSGEVIKNVQD